MTFCSAGVEALVGKSCSCIHTSSALQRPPREQAGGDPLNRSDRAHDSASVSPRSFRVTKSPGALERLWNTIELAGQSVRLILGRDRQEGRRLGYRAPRVPGTSGTGHLGYLYGPRVPRTSGTAHLGYRRTSGTEHLGYRGPRVPRTSGTAHLGRPGAPRVPRTLGLTGRTDGQPAPVLATP